MAGGGNVTIKAPKAASIAAMTSAYGRAIPLIYGKARVAANVIYQTDFIATEHKSKKSTGGKGGGGTQTNVTYSYTSCVLFGLCEGVAGSIGKIFVGKENDKTLSDYGLTFFNGSASQTALGYITTKHPGEDLAYRGLAYLGASSFNLGEDASLPSVNAEIVGRLSGVNGGATGTASGDANPADIIYDLITDANIGLGLSSSNISNLSAMRTHAQANELLVSPAYTESKPAREIIANLCQIANTGVYFSEGVAKFVPFGDVSVTANGTTYTPNLTPAYAITEDDILAADEPVKVVRKAQADAYNHVRVNYQDRNSNYVDSAVEAKDQASIERNGDRLMSEVSLNEIALTDTARRVAQQILQKASNIRNVYEFRVGWRFARLEPMDIVTVTESGLGLNAEPMRIIEIEEDDDGFHIKAEEMQVGSLGAAKYTAQVSSGYVTNFNASAGNTNTPAIFEAPIALTESGFPELWIAASGAGSWGGCNVWVSDDNATYKMVGTITGAARHGTLTATLATGAAIDTTNTLAVDLAVSGGTLTAGTTLNATDLTTLCYVGGEFISYRDATLTGGNAYNLGYLVRGAYGSSITSHAAGQKFARLDDSIFKYEYDPKFIGRTIYFKFQSFNIYGGALQDISALTAQTYTFAGAQIPTVTGLALEQSFTGDSVKVKWNLVDGASDYTIKVFDSAGISLYRTVKTTNNRYEYSWQDSLADGGPYRSVQLQVTANSANGASGAAASLTVSNAVPAALTGISTKGGYKTVSVSFNPDSSPDFAGYQVWISTSSGFTPGAGNLIYDGPDNNLTFAADATGTAIPNTATTYYLRAAAYDKFGKTGLNLSSEFSVTSLLLATGINAGDITATMIASGALDMTKFASGIRPPRVVASLPTIDGAIYKNQDTVVLTSDGKLYRAVSGSWTKAVDGADIAANTITAAKIAAGAIGAQQIAANAITADKLLVRNPNASLNDDPYCTDTSAWSIGSGITFNYGASATGAVCPTYASSTTVHSQLFTSSSKKIPLSTGKAYNVSINVATDAGNNRGMVIVVDFYNTASTWQGQAVFTCVPAAGVWTRFNWAIGAGTSNAIPSTTTNCQMYVRFLDSGSGSSSTTQYVQDFRIDELTSSTLIQDGAITTNKVAAYAIDASKIAANTITAAQIASNSITADRIDSRGLSIKDASGNVLFASGSPLDFANVGGTTKPANNATKNTVTYSTSAPISPTDGDIWVDTSVSPNVTRVRVSSAWQIGANYVNNTNQISDGAGLGTTATWSGVSGAGKPADNATVGATIGVNLGGQITAGNASTFIANAAIGAAQIGSLNASVITAGTITTDKLVAGAATAANTIATTHATTYPSSSVWSRVDTITSFTSTGAKVTASACVYVICSGLSGISHGVITMVLRVDGVDKAATAMYDTKAAYTESGGQTIRFCIPLIYQEAFSAGAHTYEINTSVSMLNSSGAATSTTGSFIVASRVVLQENKV